MRKRNIFPACKIAILGIIVLLQNIAVVGEESPKLMELADANSAFAVDLYAQLKKNEGNLIFSPYSISTALAMTYAGAGGNTEKQMADVLHFTLEQKQFHKLFSSLQNHLNKIKQKGNIQLAVTNSLWLQKGYTFKKEYLTLTKRNYGSVLNSVNFKKSETARKLINTWVEECTKNKIKELIKPGLIGALTRLVLANAVYFKGNWAQQFKKTLTSDQPFYITSSDSVIVPMMYQKEEFKYRADSNCQILEMPYEGNELSMIILLPRNTGGLSDFESSLDINTVGKWLVGLRKQKVRVYIPKFTMTSEFRLGKILALMGMPDAFSDKADFSGITAKKDLNIYEVVHKAFVKVNEEGTEAAAATAVMMNEGESAPVPEFYANHPFIFLIRDNHSNSILFIGRIVNPFKLI